MIVTRNLRLVARRHRWSSRQLTVTCKPVTGSSSPSSFSTLALASRNGVLALSQPRSCHTADFNLQCHRGYATAPKEKTTSIAILGGGLTGLATAYYITRYFPSARITIYEKSSRLGGWIDTEKVAVKTPDGKEGFVNFERGARLVKVPVPGSWRNLDGLLFWDLVSELQLEDRIAYATSDTDVGSYIYYPDHLVRLGIPPPSQFFKRPLNYIDQVGKAIIGLFTEPAFKGVFSSLSHVLFPRRRIDQKKHADMSTGDYLAAVLGSRSLVDNVVSAMMHGIYGGDVWKLSVNSSFLRWRARETQIRASKANPKVRLKWSPAPDMELLLSLLAEHSQGLWLWLLGSRPRDGRPSWFFRGRPAWMWFRDGFSTLTEALAAELQKNPNVTIKLNQNITSLAYHASDAVALASATDKKTLLYDKVISTIFAGSLSPLVNWGARRPAPTLEEIEAVSIQLVNLWYPTPGLNRPFHGFGYLIPQSVPWEQNPECALGVLFDSDREARFNPDNQGNSRKPTGDTIPGTKFTVMLGGHLVEERELPTGQQAIDMAKSVLERHLGIPKEESAHAVGSTKTCRNCIPQHFVGHKQRMAQLNSELQQAFHGKLAVIGGSYQLPGVLPSLRAAWDMAREVSPDKTSPPKLASHRVEREFLDRVCKKATEQSGPVLPTGLGRASSDPGNMFLPLSKELRTDLKRLISITWADEIYERQKQSWKE